MGKKLAIKGHVSRSKEVVELLKMMGGCENGYSGGVMDCYYYISQFGNIEASYKPYEFDTYIVYTLEEFLEVYPFKVGDKVFLYDNITEGCVTGMKWDEDKGTVKYCVYTSAEYWCDVKELLKWNAIDLVEKHYNEQCGEMMKDNTLKHLYERGMEYIKTQMDMEENKLFGTVSNPVETKSYTVGLKDGKVIDNSIESTGFMQIGKTFAVCFNTENYENEVELQLGDYEIEVRDGKTYAILKKPTYPKIYEECCKVLGIRPNISLHYTDPNVERGNSYLMPVKFEFNDFLMLRICRDAYWKIAGEEMGLDKPWEPDWTDCDQEKWAISINHQEPNTPFCFGSACYQSHFLTFPTLEMCEDFTHNFHKLMDPCKPFL